jgi:hypothetical protein
VSPEMSQGQEKGEVDFWGAFGQVQKKGASQKQGGPPSKGKNSKISTKIEIYLVLANLKKIMLFYLIHMLDWPNHGPGHILAIIHLWIMLIYTCVHIWFNILIHM